jgi:hypothetical protein
MGFVVVVVILFVIWLVKPAAGTPSHTPSRYARLVKSGLPARGILLAVTSTPVRSFGFGLGKVQVRSVQIDIEVPGRSPYEASLDVAIPLNLVRDALPGATVELRLDRRNPELVAIVGPGVGFAGASLMTQGQINQGAA